MAKLVVCIIDGMADPPPPAGGVTPLAAAHTPHCDNLARHSVAGLCHVIQPGAVPGSEAGLSALLCCEAAASIARGPVEALAQGDPVAPHETVWRLNLVSLGPRGNYDNPAPLLDAATETAARRMLDRALGTQGYSLMGGKGFRHLCAGTEPPVLRNGPQDACGMTPDTGQSDLNSHCPRLARAMTEANALFRRSRMDLAVWPWGAGTMPDLPGFAETTGQTGALAGGVPLARGLALALGMTAPSIAGATGGIDTDLGAKTRAAIALAAGHDVVYLHVEAPDLHAHALDRVAKRRAIERIDAEVVGPLHMALPDATLLITCDHATDCATGRHMAIPVPFILHKPDGPQDGIATFSEAASARTGIRIDSAATLVRLALAD